MNLLTMEQGKGRYVMMDDAIWGMILGKSGKVPGKIDPEFVELAKKQNREFTDADPHTLIPNALDGFKKEMDENGWDYGQDNEELFELAMHPEQYRPFKSGQAKKQLLADIQKAKDAKLGGSKMKPEELAAFKHAKADLSERLFRMGIPKYLHELVQDSFNKGRKSALRREGLPAGFSSIRLRI